MKLQHLIGLLLICFFFIAADGGFHIPAGRWSPYICGGLIGLLAAAAVLFSDRPLGVSTAYARIGGIIGRFAAPKFTSRLAYYKTTRPIVDWEVLLLMGVVLGGYLSARYGGTITGELLPPLWVQKFGGDSSLLRIATAFAGGGLMAYGARIAGGCTTGHGISGTMQMSVGSWVSLICFFLGGMAFVLPVYGR